jgi:hypothetical protein
MPVAVIPFVPRRAATTGMKMFAALGVFATAKMHIHVNA